MNCQDISLALDDRDIGALDESQRRAFDAHVEGCADCARDWELHQRLASTTTPPMPGFLPSRVRAAVKLPAVSGGPRNSRRLVLVGTLVAFAAAAMFAVNTMREPQATPLPLAAEAVARPAPISAPAAVEPAPVATLSVAKPAQPKVQQAPAPPAAAAAPVQQRTVRVLPLQNQGTGAAFAAVQTFYTAFIDDLRAQKGLTVFAPDATDAAADSAMFRLRVRGFGPVPEGKFSMDILMEVRNPDGSYRMLLGTMPTGDIASDCASTPPFDTMQNCRGPLHLAGAQARLTNTNLVPPDPRLQLDPLEQLLDRSLALQHRLDAFYKLRNARRLAEPGVARGALDLAAIAPLPLMRSQIWEAMRNVRSPEMLPVLVASLRGDADAQVRQQAAVTLASAFAEESQARIALEAAAQEDASPLVRELARRGVHGNESWRQYINASLVNGSRPDAERVDALVFAIQEQPTQDIMAFLQGDAALESLDDLMSRMQGTRSSGWTPLVLLMARLAGSTDPATTEVLLANMGKLDPTFKLNIMQAVAASRHADPRLRAELERFSKEESDPAVREYAAKMLKSW